ncbi:MAG: glycerophosphodiester phosphodiesterase [Candidatus Omnitrophota bacterium]
MIIIAHRGASGYKPENTIDAFETAIEMGADFIEIDVQQTSDGKIVIWHDTRLENGQALEDLTYAQLQSRAARRNLEVLLLASVLERISSRIGINIEIKTVRIIDQLLDEITVFDKNKLIISSFNHKYIKTIQSKAPELEMGTLIVSRLLDPLAILNSLNSEILIQHFEHVDQEYVDFLHKNKKKIFVWNINNQPDMLKFKKIGVDGIFTDYPDLAVRIEKNTNFEF